MRAVVAASVIADVSRLQKSLIRIASKDFEKLCLAPGMIGHSNSSLILRRYAPYLPADQKGLASLISDNFLAEKATQNN